MSNEHIDVLAVMDADGRAVSIVIDSCNSMHRRQKWDDHLADHDLARAAVAELIDALKEIRDFADHPATPVHNSVKKSAIARAALARIGGDA